MKFIAQSFMSGEKTMNRIKNILTVSTFAFLFLAVPSLVSAQWWPQNQQGGWGNHGGGPYYGGGDSRQLVKRLKDRTKDFQRQVDRELDRGRWNGSNFEDQVNRAVKDFHRAVNRLDNGNSRNSQDKYREALNIGQQVDRMIGRTRLSPNTRNLWQGIRYDLQTLGSYYGYGRGGWGNQYPQQQDPWGNGRGRNGSGRNPSWWPF
jgi:hypothetical protein